MNWLNPINWIRSAVASAIEKQVDEYLTMKQGRQLVLDLVNNAINASDEWWSDAKCRKVSRGVKLAAQAANDFAAAVDPDGADGKRITADELDSLIADTQAAFGNLVDEEWLADARAKVKAFVRQKLGLA